ncbi:MAG TPA: diphthine--ammonia ligase [Candidatus Woesearchaeota archaeon]|nr:diphthine--ammonia ligase [Candidatus Woesearchaeota archaeon]
MQKERLAFLRIGALFSGGKDSVYAMNLLNLSGNEIACLISLIPESADSMLFHVPFTEQIDTLAEAFGLPLVKVTAAQDELFSLKRALKKAIEKHSINAVCTGAIASDYQRMRISMVAEELGLRVFSPLWHKSQEKILLEETGFMNFILVTATSEGISRAVLGKSFQPDDAGKIIQQKVLSNKAFEGGEAESLALDSPMHKKKIQLTDTLSRSDSEFEHYLSGKAILVDKK